MLESSAEHIRPIWPAYFFFPISIVELYSKCTYHFVIGITQICWQKSGLSCFNLLFNRGSALWTYRTGKCQWNDLYMQMCLKQCHFYTIYHKRRIF